MNTEKNVTEEVDQIFINSFNFVATGVHETAVSKGWWDSFKKYPHLKALVDSGKLSEEETREIITALDRNTGEALCLVHSEISEALENSRDGFPPDDKVAEFKGIEAELADAIIRIMDLAKKQNWRVAEALIAKIRFNKTRPYMHGRKF